MNQENYLRSIASLMKRGRTEEIRSFFTGETQPEAQNFVGYMDTLIAASGMKRSRIAAQVGLSQDYMYKVLRGDKKTAERDYIIAFCLSMGAGLLETQKALELYPFPALDREDPRSAIIMAALSDGADRYTLDEWLSSAGLPLLKVSPDMPSAELGPAGSTVFRSGLVNSEADEEENTLRKRRFIRMEKTNTLVVAEHCGNAPFDFLYIGELELTDDDGTKVYAAAIFWPDGNQVYAVTDRSVDDEDQEHTVTLETYETLEDATASAYFPYFLELEKLTDQKVAETMAQVNDTKYYGLRLGARMTENCRLLKYAEAYNSFAPELNEYLQIRETEDGLIYSMSHKSYYMQIELGDGGEGFYEMYFGKPEDQLYLFELTNLDDLGEYEFYRSSFEQMELTMKKCYHMEGEQNHD